MIFILWGKFFPTPGRVAIDSSLDQLVEDDATQWTFEGGLNGDIRQGGCVNGGFIATSPDKEVHGFYCI